MMEPSWRKIHGHPLNVPGDQLGVRCDFGGIFIGPVPLLQKTAEGFSVRPAEDLNYVMGLALDKGFDVTRYLPALDGVARALNAGDLGQAMLRAQLMALPVLPDDQAFARAVEAEDLLKASPDDPKHPGYPAGEPGGRGGQFRPKVALLGEEAESAAEKRLVKLIARRAIRSGLRRALTVRAALRFGAELASNVDPIGPAEIGDAAMIEQAGEILAEAAEIKDEVRVATEFVRKGPWDIEDLFVSKEPEAFDSFGAFKKVDESDDEDVQKRFGDAGDGFEYHHLAEQGANGRTLSPRELNSTTNIVRLPKLLHEEVTAEQAAVRDINGARKTLRAALRGKDFEAHRQAGIRLLRDMGIVK